MKNIVVLSVTYKPFLPSVIMISVNMLSVMEPYSEAIICVCDIKYETFLDL